MTEIKHRLQHQEHGANKTDKYSKIVADQINAEFSNKRRSPTKIIFETISAITRGAPPPIKKILSVKGTGPRDGLELS